MAEEAGPIVSLCIYIRQVLGSNPYRDISYPDGGISVVSLRPSRAQLLPSADSFQFIIIHASLHHPTLCTPDIAGVIE
jgi:hypothetical protein